MAAAQLVEAVEAEKVSRDIKEIYEHIKQHAIDTAPEDIAREIEYCNANLALVSEYVAITGGIVNRETGKFANEYAEKIKQEGEKFNATIFNKLLAGKIEPYLTLEKYTERLSAALNHRLESLRSLLSFQKEQMRNAR